MTQTPNRPKIIDMSDSGTTKFQDSPQPKPKILQGIYDLPIRTKQLIGLCIAQLVSVVGLAGGGALLNQEQGRRQLESQAKSELAVVEINYNIKINQMGFGFRGQSDNVAIITVAKLARQGQSIPKDLQAPVSRILQNEIKARSIEYATLVGKDRKILVSANANRQGEIFDPNGLVTKILASTDPQIRSSEVVAWEELKKENPPLPKGFIDQDALIRYTFTQVKDPATGEVIGVLISGDIVNNKLPIVENTLKAFGGGFTAIYFRKPSGDLALASSLSSPKGQAITVEPQKVNQPLADLLVLQSAIAANGSSVTRRINQSGVNSTVAIKSILNVQNEPVALLVQATPETELEALTANNLLLLFFVILVVLAINVFLAFILGDAIAKPIKKLQDNAQRFSEGERDVRTEVFAADEVGQLTLVFNQMADQLREVINIQEAEVDRIDIARQEARQEAEFATQEQRQQKEFLQRRALELLIEVDPISRGDLTIRAKVTEDEIGTVADSYNATIESLRRIVTQVQTAAKLMTDTTTSSESSVLDLSKEAVRQSEEIALALDRIQEMSQSTRTVTASAQTAEGLVKQSAITLKEGDNAMNLTVDGILAIRSTVAETSKKVKRLGESSQKISKVVNLISSFAEQTNLLALNAAIEAARAGEEGRGFGVVADRVRSLAKQSTNASREIEVLVAEIQAETNEVVTAMEVGTEQVVIGTRLVEDARQNLNKIAEASSQINTLVETIAQASLAQSKASEIVTDTITDVAAIALNTSTEANQVSITFKDLLKISQELQKSVGQFKV